MDLVKLHRRRKRFMEREKLLRIKTKGKESQLTFHAGYELGYISGKLDEIENTIDDIEDEIERGRR